MSSAAVPTLQACVAFFRFEPQQADPRELLRTVLAGWPDDSRLVVQAPDGAAIVALDDPMRLLDAILRAAATSRLTAGLHRGPVHVSKVSDETQISGAGLTGARSAAGSVAHPVVLTPEFRGALVAAAPDAASALAPVAMERRPGAPGRELFTCDPAWGRLRRQRRMLVGGGIVAGILGFGVVTRAVRQGLEASQRPGFVQFVIKPAGEIWVDGEFKGNSPPITRLSLRPGHHALEVRSGSFKPLKLNVELKAGEELQVSHTFKSSSGARDFWDKLKFW